MLLFLFRLPGPGQNVLLQKILGYRFLDLRRKKNMFACANLGWVSATKVKNVNGTVPEKVSKKKLEGTNSGVPSLLKWTGSKRAQAATIRALLPEFRRYVEPFVGGGALLYSVAGENAIAGDIYEPLVKFWQLVQSEPQTLVDDYENQWAELQRELAALKGASIKKRGAFCSFSPTSLGGSFYGSREVQAE